MKKFAFLSFFSFFLFLFFSLSVSAVTWSPFPSFQLATGTSGVTINLNNYCNSNCLYESYQVQFINPDNGQQVSLGFGLGYHNNNYFSIRLTGNLLEIVPHSRTGGFVLQITGSDTPSSGDSTFLSFSIGQLSTSQEPIPSGLAPSQVTSFPNSFIVRGNETYVFPAGRYFLEESDITLSWSDDILNRSAFLKFPEGLVNGTSCIDGIAYICVSKANNGDIFFSFQGSNLNNERVRFTMEVSNAYGSNSFILIGNFVPFFSDENLYSIAPTRNLVSIPGILLVTGDNSTTISVDNAFPEVGTRYLFDFNTMFSGWTSVNFNVTLRYSENQNRVYMYKVNFSNATHLSVPTSVSYEYWIANDTLILSTYSDDDDSLRNINSPYYGGNIATIGPYVYPDPFFGGEVTINNLNVIVFESRALPSEMNITFYACNSAGCTSPSTGDTLILRIIDPQPPSINPLYYPQVDKNISLFSSYSTAYTNYFTGYADVFYINWTNGSQNFSLLASKSEGEIKTQVVTDGTRFIYSINLYPNGATLVNAGGVEDTIQLFFTACNIGGCRSSLPLGGLIFQNYNIVSNATTSQLPPTNSTIFDSFYNTFNSLFPDSDTLTTTQKSTFVAITLALVVMLAMVAGLQPNIFFLVVGIAFFFILILLTMLGYINYINVFVMAVIVFGVWYIKGRFLNG